MGRVSPPRGPLAKRLDHLVVRADDPLYLAEVFSETLGLPVVRPAFTLPGVLTSVLVSAGDTTVELVRFGDPPEEPLPDPRALLWGVAFEPTSTLEETGRELASRGIPHDAPRTFERPDVDGGWQPLWRTLPVDLIDPGRRSGAGLFVRRSSGKLLESFHRKRMRRAVTAARNGEKGGGSGQRSADPTGFVHGGVLFKEYDPSFSSFSRIRSDSREALRAAGGGILGVQEAEEVVVGATDPAAARARWQAFFDPVPEWSPDLWRAGAGPGLRLVPDRMDRLRSLVLRVSSLAAARRALRGIGMLEELEGYTAVAPPLLGSLDVRLVE